MRHLQRDDAFLRPISTMVAFTWPHNGHLYLVTYPMTSAKLSHAVTRGALRRPT